MQWVYRVDTNMYLLHESDNSNQPDDIHESNGSYDSYELYE
jgi:hypothetical protein